MNIEHAEPASGAQLGKSALLVGAWIGSVTLSDIQAIVGIISGLAVLTYTLINIYVAWRDKLRVRE